jgi:hypothetical protein
MKTYRDKRGIEWFFHCLVCGEDLPIHSHSSKEENYATMKPHPENPSFNTISEDEIPNPGSDAALKLGCTCPVLDNSHGWGYLGKKDQFVVKHDCPLHGTNPLNADDEMIIG